MVNRKQGFHTVTASQASYSKLIILSHIFNSITPHFWNTVTTDVVKKKKKELNKCMRLAESCIRFSLYLTLSSLQGPVTTTSCCRVVCFCQTWHLACLLNRCYFGLVKSQNLLVGFRLFPHIFWETITETPFDFWQQWLLLAERWLVKHQQLHSMPVLSNMSHKSS